MSFPSLRPRIGGVGAISRILGGAFGMLGSPQPASAVDVRGSAPIYAFHQGDVFVPGAENFVFESQLELPVTAWWGAGSGILQGTPYPVNAWPVYAAAPPIIALPVVTRVGLGGLQAGAFVQQPLVESFIG